MNRMQSETTKRGLPAVIAPDAPRARLAPRSSFLSQLIAARQREAVPPGTLTDPALAAYADTSRRLVRRLPSGYRTSLSA